MRLITPLLAALGMASALRDPDQSAPPPEDDYYDLEAARVLAMLGEPAFSAAFQAGKNVPIDRALSETADTYTTFS